MSQPRPDGTDLIDFWYAALQLPIGLSIKTNDRKLLQAQLYRARQEQGTAELEDLGIAWPDKEGELWILHKKVMEPGYASNSR